MLGFESQTNTYGVESWAAVKAELSGIILGFIVDSPSNVGFNVANMFRRVNPDVPWQTPFQMMACEASEQVRVNGINLLSTLLSSPPSSHSLYAHVTKLRLQFESSFV